jgi:hypothetical protein
MGSRAIAPITPAPSLRDSYLTERQLAKELPKGTVRKLRDWRRLRIGPPWLKVGREVVYLRESVEEWLRANELVVTREHRQSRRGAR